MNIFRSNNKIARDYYDGYYDQQQNRSSGKSLKERVQDAMVIFNDGGGRLPVDEFFDHIEFEYRKLVVMERAFIKIKEKMEKNNIAEFRELIKVYAKYDKENDTIAAYDFCEMMEKMGVIQTDKSEDLEYFFHEYGILPATAQEKNLEMMAVPDLEVKQSEGSKGDGSARQNQNSAQKSALGSGLVKAPQQVPGAEDAKVMEAMNAEEHNLKIQEEIRQSTFFKLDEIESDYRDFDQIILNDIQDSVLELLSAYVEEVGTNTETRRRFDREQDEVFASLRFPRSFDDLFFQDQETGKNNFKPFIENIDLFNIKG